MHDSHVCAILDAMKPSPFEQFVTFISVRDLHASDAFYGNLLGLPLALVVAPLALYAASEPAIYLGRAEQVSIFHRPEGWRALLENVGAVTGAFLWRGDLNARHNLPGRPVFDPLLSAAFWAGVGLAAYRLWRARDTACALALLWTGTMLAPTLFSDKAPHFLRAIGALPMLFAFPAL
ncbi:MAG: hypothetical protein RMJ54_15960, partial [Roseiflexaceae bacterium]|nr:hypothetical protein [Roseiflexaceae bacterium]